MTLCGIPALDRGLLSFISANTMNSWIRERTSVKLNTIGKREIISDFDEIKKLKQELAQVTRERDLLKKATAYFARDFT